MTPSPLNYVGNKKRLLPQILPLLPDNIDTFVDLFAGGCTVGINIPAQKVLLNDLNRDLILIYDVIQGLPTQKALDIINSIITKFGLSTTGAGTELSRKNKAPYNLLRSFYNQGHGSPVERALMLYVIIVYAFNMQYRRGPHGFNLPVGKGAFTDKIRQRFIEFSHEIKANKYDFKMMTFQNLLRSQRLPEVGTYIYADPPYLITNAAYNAGWNNNLEETLYAELDRINHKGGKFGLSNVIEANGRKNDILQNWVNQKGYKMHVLDYNYKSCSYNKLDKSGAEKEVFVTNC